MELVIDVTYKCDSNCVYCQWNSKNNYRDTYGLGFAYGKKLNSWLRLEGEFTYVRAHIDSITNHYSREVDASGKEELFTLMANAVADWKNNTA